MEHHDYPVVQVEVVDPRTHREVPIARKLSRTDRVIFWLCGDEVGRGFLGVTSALLIGGPMFLFGWWWVAVLTGTLLGFVTGYWLARRAWLDDGNVPPL